jgi:hypothetical protein
MDQFKFSGRVSGDLTSSGDPMTKKTDRDFGGLPTLERIKVGVPCRKNKKEIQGSFTPFRMTASRRKGIGYIMTASRRQGIGYIHLGFALVGFALGG